MHPLPVARTAALVDGPATPQGASSSLYIAPRVPPSDIPTYFLPVHPKRHIDSNQSLPFFLLLLCVYDHVISPFSLVSGNVVFSCGCESVRRLILLYCKALGFRESGFGPSGVSVRASTWEV